MIQRTIYEKILKSIETKPVTLITGARQVGKTTICKMLVKEKGYNYVSLDNSRELSSAVNDPAMFLKMHPAPLIIDEVQKCKDLFAEIESIVNEARFNDIEECMFLPDRRHIILWKTFQKRCLEELRLF